MKNKTIIHKRNTPIKKRSQSCYDKKCKKLEKVYSNCPKIREKYTLEQWLSKVKKVMDR